MRIVYLIAGSGGAYCGSCLHGNTLASALRHSGNDVVLAPLYMPLRTDEEDVSVRRIAFGGVNVYLQQRSAVFRHTPWVVDRLLDRRGLLARLARSASATRPEDLGAITVSMLQGRQGRQRKELAKLLAWLKRQVRPEIVHLSTALLAGLARPISEELGVPVVCSLTGEDAFLERLPDPHYWKAKELLHDRLGDVAMLVALSRYYADFMAEYLAWPRQRIAVVPPGLNLQGHASQAREPARRRARTIGFLGRIVPEKGLHLVAEAFRMLANDPCLAPVMLRAAGSLSRNDGPYIDRVLTQLGQSRIADHFQYLGELDRPGKISFLQSLDVATMPSLFPESKGLAVLEALANGVPVVVPDHGALRELVLDTGGGLLVRPQDAHDLAHALKKLLLDPELAAELGRRGQKAVHHRYHAGAMAQRMVAVYQTVVTGKSAA